MGTVLASLVAVTALTIAPPRVARADAHASRPCDARALLTAALPEVESGGTARLNAQRPIGHLGLERRHLGPHAPGKPAFRLVEDVIRYASEKFKRRGWSMSFLDERLELARRFWRGSEYFVVHRIPRWQSWMRSHGTPIRKNFQFQGPIVGSLGLSTARAGAKDPFLRLLPMEHSHGWRLPESPLKFELRTYAMDEALHEDVFPLLFSDVVGAIQRRVPPGSALSHEKILYTYGDDISIRLYRRMGFELVEGDPRLPAITHEGTTWRVLRISPADLMYNHRRMAGVHTLTPDVGAPARVRAAGGRELLAQPGSAVKYHRDRVVEIVLADAAEVLPGVRAAAGATVTWSESGELRSISALAERTRVANLPRTTEAGFPADAWLAPGGAIEYHYAGAPRRICCAESRFALGDDGRFAVAPGGAVELDYLGRVEKITALGDDVEVLPGHWASRDTPLWFRPATVDGTLLSSWTLARDVRLTPDITLRSGTGVFSREGGGRAGLDLSFDLGDRVRLNHSAPRPEDVPPPAAVPIRPGPEVAPGYVAASDTPVVRKPDPANYIDPLDTVDFTLGRDTKVRDGIVLRAGDRVSLSLRRRNGQPSILRVSGRHGRFWMTFD